MKRRYSTPVYQPLRVSVLLGSGKELTNRSRGTGAPNHSESVDAGRRSSADIYTPTQKKGHVRQFVAHHGVGQEHAKAVEAVRATYYRIHSWLYVTFPGVSASFSSSRLGEFLLALVIYPKL